MFVVGGESLIDLISKPVGPDGRRELVAKAGGSPMNCAIALARLGNEAGFLCPISRDSFGDFILEPLNAAGVKVLLGERVREPSTLAVVTDDGRGNPRYAFYREADRAFTRDGLIAALPERVELFQIGGFCTIEPADMAVWLEVAREARRRGALLSTDPNLRPSLIADLDAYRQRVLASLDLVSLVKLSEEDLHTLDASKSIEQHADALLERPNIELVVVTLEGVHRQCQRARRHLSGGAGRRQCRGRRYADGGHPHLAQGPRGAGGGPARDAAPGAVAADAVVRRRGRRHQLQPRRRQSADAGRGGCRGGEIAWFSLGQPLRDYSPITEIFVGLSVSRGSALFGACGWCCGSSRWWSWSARASASIC